MKKQSLMEYIKKTGALIVILALAVFLRIHNIFATTGLMGDTGRDLLVARHIAFFSASTSIAPATQSELLHNTSFYYLLISVLWLTTHSTQGVIIFFALIQSMVVFVAYYLGKLAYGKSAGYYFGLYVAIAPQFVELSRWIWQLHFFVLLIPLLFLLFFRVILAKNYRKNFLKLFSFFVIANACMHLHYSSLAIVSFLFLWLIKDAIKKKQKVFIISLLAFISIFFRFVSGFNFEVLKINTIKSEKPALNWNQVAINSRSLGEALQNSIFLGIDNEYQPLLGGIFMFVLAGTVVTFFKERPNKSYQYYMYILIVSVATGFCYIFYWRYAQMHYFLPFVITLHLFIASALFYLMKFSRKFKELSIVLAFILLLLFFRGNKNMRFGENEIGTLRAIAQDIIEDHQKHNKRFSIELVNPIYDPTESQSAFNAGLWLILEEQLQQPLITVSPQFPIVIEPKNFNILYKVTIVNGHTKKYILQKFVYQ